MSVREIFGLAILPAKLMWEVAKLKYFFAFPPCHSLWQKILIPTAYTIHNLLNTLKTAGRNTQHHLFGFLYKVNSRKMCQFTYQGKNPQSCQLHWNQCCGWCSYFCRQLVLQKKLLQLSGCDKSSCEPGLARISLFCKDSKVLWCVSWTQSSGQHSKFPR